MTTSAMTTSAVHANLPWATTADGELTRTGVSVGAVLGTIAVFTCFPLGILGIVLNCMGLDRVQHDPESAHRFMRASWTTLAVAPFVTLGLIALFS